MKYIVFTLLVLIILIGNIWDSQADNKLPKSSKKDWIYYGDKGNNGIPITREEFDILMSELQKHLEGLGAALRKISIAELNISYKDGTFLEAELQSIKSDLNRGLKYVDEVKKNPSSMWSSLVLYVTMTRIYYEVADFDRFVRFQKILNGRHFDLRHWTMAFEKTHLLPLANAKDKNRNLNLY